jgi:hypothetical protein
MDIEQKPRQRLVDSLERDFICLEECNVRPAVFPNSVIRADVLAFARREPQNLLFAFEIKVPTAKWEFKDWIGLIKQASSYSDATIDDKRAPAWTQNQKIQCSFIYPEPTLSPWNECDSQQNRFYRDYDRDPIRGALLLSQHFQVGCVGVSESDGRHYLKLGTDTLWTQRAGFRPKVDSRPFSRRIGSRNFDLSDL